jgi:hypothetical protein
LEQCHQEQDDARSEDNRVGKGEDGGEEVGLYGGGKQEEREVENGESERVRIFLEVR